MRSLAGLATVLFGAAAALPATAQTFSTHTDPVAATLAAELNQAAFAPNGGWTSGVSKLGGAVVAPLAVPSLRTQFEAHDVAVTRDWPGAVSFDGKVFGFDVSPHAGVGVTTLGGSAEAGAMVQISKRDSLSESASQRLKALGLRDGARFGDRGRWYLFAAASGRAVGLNMLHSDTGWDRAGWSQDATSTLIGDAQVGVGFRKGPVQTSLGYIHREVKGPNMLWGVDAKGDDAVAFTLSIKPHR